MKSEKVARAHARQVLEDFEKAKARGLNDVEAAAEASAADLLRAEAGRARTAQQIIKETAALENAAGHKRKVRAGTRAVFVDDPWGMAGYLSVDGAARAMQKWLEAKFADGILFLEGLGLVPNKISARAFVREVKGESTGDAVAAAAARAWKEVDEYSVKMRQAEGSTVQPLENYLPQPQNPARVRQMGRQAYVDAMMARYDDGRLHIPDWDVPGASVSRARALEIVEEAWESIATEGLNKLELGARGKYKLANVHSERRVFHWTTADAYLDAMNTFGYGEGAIFDMLMGHIHAVSREWGMLRVLGPNPDQTAKKLIDQAEKGGRRMLGGFVGTRAHLEAVYDQVSGRALSPENEGLARMGRTLASGLRAAQLGSATISAVGDAATTLKTADFNGLSKTKVLKRYLESATSQGREQALRIGLGAETASAVGRMGFAESLESGIAKLASLFSDVVMKVSLLQPHTRMARHAIGWEFLADLAYLAKQDRAWNQLPGRTLRAFERAGISEADWTLMKAAGVRDASGVSMMSPEQLAKSAEGEGINAAVKLQALVNREMDMAAPVGGAFERALLQGRHRPGGLAMEFLVRPFATYKSYPVSVITHHGFRMAATFLEEGFGPGMVYASLALTMTALGAVALQAKNLSQGKDPQSMRSANFWIHAFVQGGGAGIFGDFLWSATNRADQGALQTLMGPQWGLANDLAKLTFGNIKALGDEKDTHAGREVANVMRRYTPGTSLWYTRLSLDRLLWDAVQKELDPDYHQAFRRIEQRSRREFGVDYWWAPGREPTRGPDLGAAIEPSRAR